MKRVSITETGADLAALIALIQSGQEDSVVFTQDGRPIVRMEGCAEEPDGRHIRFGVAKGGPDDTGGFDGGPEADRDPVLSTEEIASRILLKDGVRIGIAEGKLRYPDDIRAFDDEIAEMFGVGP